MHITTLDDLIKTAITRRDQQMAEIARLKAEEMAQKGADFEAYVNLIFGADFLSLLPEWCFEQAGSNVFALRFTYHGRRYSLTEGRNGMHLIRLDPRDKDDDREYPWTHVYTHRQIPVPDNRFVFLCALLDLDAKPELPPCTPAEPAEPATTPTIEQQFMTLLRNIIQHEIRAVE